jgi:hypothetical protein
VSRACGLTCAVWVSEMARSPRDDLQVPSTEREDRGGGRGVQYRVAGYRFRLPQPSRRLRQGFHHWPTAARTAGRRLPSSDLAAGRDGGQPAGLGARGREVARPGAGHRQTRLWRFYYSGANAGKRRRGDAATRSVTGIQPNQSCLAQGPGCGGRGNRSAGPYGVGPGPASLLGPRMPGNPLPSRTLEASGRIPGPTRFGQGSGNRARTAFSRAAVHLARSIPVGAGEPSAQGNSI